MLSFFSSHQYRFHSAILHSAPEEVDAADAALAELEVVESLSELAFVVVAAEAFVPAVAVVVELVAVPVEPEPDVLVLEPVLVEPVVVAAAAAAAAVVLDAEEHLRLLGHVFVGAVELVPEAVFAVAGPAELAVAGPVELVLVEPVLVPVPVLAVVALAELALVEAELVPAALVEFGLAVPEPVALVAVAVELVRAALVELVEAVLLVVAVAVEVEP